MEMFLLAYMRGIPFDLLHAVSTVIFLWLIAKPMIEKIERIKMKYGLIEPENTEIFLKKQQNPLT